MYQIKHASTRARQSLRIRRVIVSRMTRGCVMSLCHAVTGGEVETVRALLARGEDPNQLEEGSPPIGWAMSMLSLKRRREDGHRIQGPDAAGAVRDVFACVELCLDAGADPNVLWDERVCGTPLDEEDINRARRESSVASVFFAFIEFSDKIRTE